MNEESITKITWQSYWHANRKQKRAKSEAQFFFYYGLHNTRHDRYVDAYNNRLKQIGF